MTSPDTRKEAAFFLKFLQEEGIEEIYIERKQSTPSPNLMVGYGETAVQGGPSGRTAPQNDENTSELKQQMMALRDQALACTKCSELYGSRTKVVFGSGNIKARLMFVGEAPGFDEDQQGLPFVGKAGQLLTKIIESIGLTREQVFIANTLKCRPPGNRQPQPDEIQNCWPFLQKQIELIQPEIICALGNFAAQTLLKSTSTISKLRGRFHDYNGTKLMCTFHPAYLLRNPEEKRKVWEDMKMIHAELRKGAETAP